MEDSSRDDLEEATQKEVEEAIRELERETDDADEILIADK